MKIPFLATASLAAISAFALTPSAFAQARLAGDWQGTLDANGTTFHLVWHLTAAPDGTFTSTFDNLDEGVYGIKAKTTTIKGSDVAADVDDTVQANGQPMKVSGSLVGKLNADGTEMTGTFTQVEPEAQPTANVVFKHSAAQAASPTVTQQSIAGDWAGTLKAGPAELRLVLHITAAKDGSLTATLDSVDQGANGIPINTVTLKEGKLNLDVQAVKGTYDGTVTKDASEINGTWSQGQPLELSFKRAQPQAAAAAPKLAAPSDIDGTWQGSLDTPKGTLRILFKIVNTETGLTATMQSPDQAPVWMPTTSVTRSGGKITIDMKAFGASFEGQINAAKDTIEGTFNQGGGSLPLVLKKS
ncbi:MAG TPA: hypothetical protein VK574_05405 [Terracidiphilus sp.]|jgi:hypothetical protein|nr:hypothetical protein [Terracidiphilus sp.]